MQPHSNLLLKTTTTTTTSMTTATTTSTTTSLLVGVIRRGVKRELSDKDKEDDTTKKGEKKQKTGRDIIRDVLAALPKAKPLPSAQRFGNSGDAFVWFRNTSDSIFIRMRNTEFPVILCNTLLDLQFINERNVMNIIVLYIPVEEFYLTSAQNTINSDLNGSAVSNFVTDVIIGYATSTWWGADAVVSSMKQLIRNSDMKESLSIVKNGDYLADTRSYFPRWASTCINSFPHAATDVVGESSDVLRTILRKQVFDAENYYLPCLTAEFFEFLQLTGLIITEIPPPIDATWTLALEIAKFFISNMIFYNCWEELSTLSSDNIKGIAKWVERYYNFETVAGNAQHHLTHLTLNVDDISSRTDYNFMKTWLLLESHGAKDMGTNVLYESRRFTSELFENGDLPSSPIIDEQMPLHEDDRPGGSATLGEVLRDVWRVPDELSVRQFIAELYPTKALLMEWFSGSSQFNSDELHCHFFS